MKKQPVDKTLQSAPIEKAETVEDSTIWDPIPEEEDEPEFESIDDVIKALRNSGVKVTHEKKGLDDFKVSFLEFSKF